MLLLVITVGKHYIIDPQFQGMLKDGPLDVYMKDFGQNLYGFNVHKNRKFIFTPSF